MRIAELEEVLKGILDIFECPDCEGAGIIGHTEQGKPISCELCHGDEDDRGDGFLLYVPEDKEDDLLNLLIDSSSLLRKVQDDADRT